jgi:hypothetical protein
VEGFLFIVLAAAMWIFVIAAAVLSARRAPDHPFRSIRQFKQANRSLAVSSQEGPRLVTQSRRYHPKGYQPDRTIDLTEVDLVEQGGPRR